MSRNKIREAKRMADSGGVSVTVSTLQRNPDNGVFLVRVTLTETVTVTLPESLYTNQPLQ